MLIRNNLTEHKIRSLEVPKCLSELFPKTLWNTGIGLGKKAMGSCSA